MNIIWLKAIKSPHAILGGKMQLASVEGGKKGFHQLQFSLSSCFCLFFGGLFSDFIYFGPPLWLMKDDQLIESFLLISYFVLVGRSININRNRDESTMRRDCFGQAKCRGIKAATFTYLLNNNLTHDSLGPLAIWAFRFGPPVLRGVTYWPTEDRMELNLVSKLNLRKERNAGSQKWSGLPGQLVFEAHKTFG